jgi:hypothetical protein
VERREREPGERGHAGLERVPTVRIGWCLVGAFFGEEVGAWCEGEEAQRRASPGWMETYGGAPVPAARAEGGREQEVARALLGRTVHAAVRNYLQTLSRHSGFVYTGHGKAVRRRTAQENTKTQKNMY